MSESNRKFKSGWRQVRFGDMVRQCKEKADPETSGLERYIAGDHMDTDDLRLRRWGEIGSGYLGPAFHMRFKPGQVLYGSRRTYLRKVAMADFEGICANTTFVLEPNNPDELLPELLPFLMQTEAFNDFSVKNSKGSVNPYINFSDLARFEFALPCLEEQRRLVSVLRGHMEILDALQDLERAARALRKSLLFDRAEAIRRNSTVTLDSVVADGRPITYGIVKPGLPYPGGIPVVKVRDFPDGVVLEDDLLLTSPEIEKDYKRSRLLPGDLLFSIRGTVGRMAFVPKTLEGAQITQDTARLTISSNFDPRYVRYMLESPNAVSQVKANTMGLAVQGINLSDLRKVTIPACDLSQQAELADELDEISQGVRSLIDRKNIALRQFAGARQILLGGEGDV